MHSLLVLVLLATLSLHAAAAATAPSARSAPKSKSKVPENPPFISIPIVKSHGYQDAKRLTTLGPAAVHQRHVNHSVRRLVVAISRSKSGSTHKLSRELHAVERRSPPSGQRRRRHSILSSLTQSKSDDTEHIESVSDSNSGDGVQATHTGNTASASANFPNESKSHSNAKTGHKSDSEVTKAHSTNWIDSEPLDIEANDIGYLLSISIGTPPRVCYFLVDSGSSDMWVSGEGCRGDDGGGCGDHRFVGKNSSSTFRDTGVSWSISYGTGDVSGTLVTDRVGFAGLVLRNHTFGATQNESSQFTGDDIPLDGVLGFGGQTLSMQQTPTFVNALYSKGLIERKIVSYSISRMSDEKNDGEITLGMMDPTKYDALSLVRVDNINQGGYWEAELDGIKVNGKDVRLAGRSCIFDTGTTLFLAPKQDVAAIHGRIPGAVFDSAANAWTLPCNTTAVVSLGFGGVYFTIEPRDLAFLPLDQKYSPGMCTSAISEGGVGAKQVWLVGDVFLKNVYLSTDEGKNEISIARSAE